MHLWKQVYDDYEIALDEDRVTIRNVVEVYETLTTVYAGYSSYYSSGGGGSAGSFSRPGGPKYQKEVGHDRIEVLLGIRMSKHPQREELTKNLKKATTGKEAIEQLLKFDGQQFIGFAWPLLVCKVGNVYYCYHCKWSMPLIICTDKEVTFGDISPILSISVAAIEDITPRQMGILLENIINKPSNKGKE